MFLVLENKSLAQGLLEAFKNLVNDWGPLATKNEMKVRLWLYQGFAIEYQIILIECIN